MRAHRSSGPMIAMSAAQAQMSDTRAAMGLLHRLGNLDKTLSARLFLNAQPGTAVYRALRLVELLGNGWIWLPLPVLVVLLTPKVAMKHRSLLLSLAIGFVFDLACMGVLKAIFRRPRPKYNAADGLQLLSDKYSFPSGHSSRVFLIFALAVVHEGRALGLSGGFLVFLWACMTAVCRVMQGRHYVGDIFVGALCGLLEAAAVMYAPATVQRALEQPLTQRLGTAAANTVATGAAAGAAGGSRLSRRLMRAVIDPRAD